MAEMTAFETLRAKFPNKSDAELRAALASAADRKKARSPTNVTISIQPDAAQRPASAGPAAASRSDTMNVSKPERLAAVRAAAARSPMPKAHNATPKTANRKHYTGRELQDIMLPGRRNSLFVFRVAKIGTFRTFVEALLTLVIYSGVSCAVMMRLEPNWTFVDALYFAMATMSTVGYGDLSPSNTAAQVVAAIMIVVGVAWVFSQIAGAITVVTAPITAKGRQLLEVAFPQQGIDIDGDGGIDFYKPRPPALYYLKNLFPSLLLNVSLQVASALIFCAIDPSWDFGTAWYHCVVTATTVGYGDISNSTQAGRLWSCFHILVSVALLGELIQTFDELRVQRGKTMARITMLTTRLTDDMLDHLLEHATNLRPLVKRDGLGLTELEFVLAMMLELGVVEYASVQPFIKQCVTLARP